MEHNDLFSKRRCYQHKVHNPNSTSGFQRNRRSSLSDKTLPVGTYRTRCDTCSNFHISKETEIQTWVLRALLSLNIPAAIKHLHIY